MRPTLLTFMSTDHTMTLIFNGSDNVKHPNITISECSAGNVNTFVFECKAHIQVCQFLFPYI